MYAYAYDSNRIRRPRPLPTWRRQLRKLAIGAAVFVFTAFAMAQAVHGSAPAGYMSITVAPGDTLWSIASRRYPGADTREKVDEILRANSLTSPEIYSGEELRVPTS